MKLATRRSHSVSRALALAAFASILCVAALGQDGAPPTPGARSVDAAADAAPSRRATRDRRRSDRTSTPAEERATVTAASAAPAVAEPVAETVEAKLVCRTIKPTGTRVGRRICGTPEQWAASEKASTDAAQEGMRQVRDRSSVVVSQPDNPLAPGR
jgi:hypothetical protein